MNRRKCLIWIVVVLAFSGAAWSAVVEGTLHRHSALFSDGTQLPPTIISLTRGFLGESDHYNKMIGPTSAITAANFYLYRKSFKTDKLPVLLGAEFTAKEGKFKSDILGFGQKPIVYDQELAALTCKEGVQERLLDRLSALGYLTIAAHPHKSGNLFDWSAIRGLDGIEFFNDGSVTGEKQTFIRFIQLVAKGHKLIAVGGSDQHTPADLDYLKREKRKTGVKTEGPLTPENIFLGMKAGQTWAIRNGLSLVSMNYWPGFVTQPVRGQPEFQLDLKVSGRKVPEIGIYRDGNLAAIMYGQRRGGGIYRYCWLDQTKGLRGGHSYILGDDDLITSPIYLDIHEGPANQSTASASTGRLPLFRGKTRAEVKGTLGQPSEVLSSWQLLFPSPSGYQTQVDFDWTTDLVDSVTMELLGSPKDSSKARTAFGFLPSLALNLPLKKMRLGYNPKENILIILGNFQDRYFKIMVTHPTKKVWRSEWYTNPSNGARMRKDRLAIDWRTAKVLYYYESGAGWMTEYPAGLGIDAP